MGAVRRGNRRTSISPPTDAKVAALIAEVSEWSEDVGWLIRWLRETGMRLAEALNLRASDIHPGGAQATLRLGVIRNRGVDGGPMTRTINLGRAAPMLADLPAKGRLFARLPADSAVVSRRGRASGVGSGRGGKTAAQRKRVDPLPLPVFRLHNLRHAFAVASLVDDPDCIYRLSAHLGHTLVSTTEIYTGHLWRDGAMWPRPGPLRVLEHAGNRGPQGGLITPPSVEVGTRVGTLHEKPLLNPLPNRGG